MWGKAEIDKMTVKQFLDMLTDWNKHPEEHYMIKSYIKDIKKLEEELA